MSDEQASRAGTEFGPYHLKRLLGRGGMGEVYEAEHTVKEWTVAVKLLSETFSRDPVFRERMKREARTAGRLQEPHVVPIHDYGEIDGQMFLEMRLIEGTDLDSVLKRFGPLAPPRAVAIITQIASALDAAHAAGVMHRDVKPQNILVTRDDFAYLVDFGIASATTDEKLTQLGTAVGTWKYMAPERFSNAEVTYRADIYALACVLYECLTGSPPYTSSSAGALVTAHTMNPIPQPTAVRPGIPKGFDAVVTRGMAKKPEDRYASAGDLALAAHDALSDPDQDHAATILRRSQEATLPGTVMAPPPPPRPAANTPPPSPGQNAPTPTPALGSTPVPGQSAPPWRPDSGPIPAAAQPPVTPPYYQAANANWGSAPQQFGGPPAWNQPPPKRRNPWPIVAAVAALVIVVVLAAVGIAIFMGGDDSNPQANRTSTTTTTRTVPTTTTTTRPANPQGKLLGMLPAGYPSGACTPATPKSNSIWVNALAMVDCDQNTNQGGPSRAVYGLFANTDLLKKAFDDDVAAVQLMNCPGAGTSPDGWHHDSTPSVTAGMIACGTYKNHPNVIWTNEAKLMLCDVYGDPPAIEDLHTWWTNYGG
ncbi:protein kinase [Mycobacterium sp. 852002-53434_SCH5985345]|uniref:serine/threonine-protein kinase n=1 Tax=unclassified Mycobacterium TaxID=2642494 RepID=UPI0007FDE951|nr:MULTISPECIES: serine/threonine-protein kinase [unclassified Mycobacterium]OBF55068.1 protein kinase [Mycobacterium sp. 852002-53434_SCH5985345]OBF75797.1 protein kinase [Mycobacterium sp. 852002-51613_SCH5001154]